MCNSKDPDVECSDRYQGLLRYQVCYRETLKCGSDQIFLVNEPMTTMTSDFFTTPGICIYKLKTYESNDLVRQNITFTKVRKAETHVLYKKLGSSNYTEETVELSDNENYTLSIKREQLDPSDKNIYVIVKALSPNESDS
jgi:hypothetical protein